MKHIYLLGMLIFTSGAIAQNATPPSTATSAQSGQVLNVILPDPGNRYVRFIPSADGKQQAQLPKHFSDHQTMITFDPEAIGKTAKVAVDDVATGNTAIKSVPTGGTLDLKKSDFDRVHSVEVYVTYSGKPVQSAVVTLETSEKVSSSKTLDPTSKGTAHFYDVPAGKAKLTLLYNDKLKETKDIEISTDHQGNVVVIPAVVSNATPTMDAPTPAATSDAGGNAVKTPPADQPGAGTLAPRGYAQPQPEANGGIMSLLSNLLGIAIIGGLGYLLYRWIQSGGMATTLQKAGIEVAAPTEPPATGTPWQPNTAPPPVVADPSLCPFCGQKKDAAGGCACTLGAGAVSSAATPGVPSQPRLVATVGAYSGTVFPVTGTVTIGREPTNGISLSNDNTVSRHHATLRVETGSYTIVDEGSANGIYVNGVRISGSQPLNPGDEAQIGNTRFRFEL